MRRKLYDITENDEIFNITEEEQEPIIEGLLFKQDYVLLVAEPKRCKTIFSQQMTCCLTQGTPFLNTFNIPKPVKVWYFATEGKKNDLKDRFTRMERGVGLNSKNLVLITTRFRFNTPEGRQSLNEILARYAEDRPGVIFIDALYRAIKGSITSDEVVNEFHHIVGMLSHECNDAAIVLIHHMTKPQRDKEGNYYNRTDTDAYGSAFLPAAVDHIFWLDRCKKDKKDLILKCDTQRSGNVIDDMRLKLIEPDPLYLELSNIYEEERHKILELLRNHSEGLTYNALMVRGKMSKSTFYRAKKSLHDEELIDVVVGQKNKIKIREKENA